MKKFLGLLSIFAVVALLFTSCEGSGGGDSDSSSSSTATAEGCWFFPTQMKTGAGNAYYMGYYLTNGTKYMLYSKDKKTAFYATDAGEAYTITDKKVRFNTSAMTYSFSSTKLTQSNNSSVYLEKVTLSATPTGKTATECMAEMDK